MNQIEEYRAALDGLRFSEEAKERIRKDMMEQADVKRRRFRPLRPALIAAALCAALVGTGFAAAGLSGLRVIDFFNKESRSANEGWKPEVYSGYIVQGDIQYYPMEALSEQVAEIGGTAAQGVTRKFATWEDMESFIGMDVMNNPILESAHHEVVHDVYHQRVLDYTAYVNVEDGEVPRVCMSGDFLLHPGEGLSRDRCVKACLSGDLYTENATEPEYYTMRLYYVDGTEISQKEYTTPGGLSAVIFRVDLPEELSSFRGSETEFNAVFTLNGIQFTLTVRDCEDADFLYTVLLELLDGFTA